MSWLTSYVKPKLERAFSQKETPDNLWHKCQGCGELIYMKDYLAALRVCGNCNHHGRMGPKERFDALFDGGAYETLECPKVVEDPLKFRDQKRYTDRLRDARSKTGDADAGHVAAGRLGGIETVAFVENFFFMGGSMGLAVGEAFVAAADAAIARRAPLVAFVAAGGARMQEGILSLMQLPRTTVAVERMKDAGLPYIVVLTDPTTGGVTASFAMLGDVHLAEPGALIGFAGPRVIKETIRETLPDGFQRAEYLKDHGMVDKVVARGDMRATLSRLIALMTHDGAAQADLARTRAAEADVAAAAAPADATPAAEDDPRKARKAKAEKPRKSDRTDKADRAEKPDGQAKAAAPAQGARAGGAEARTDTPGAGEAAAKPASSPPADAKGAPSDAADGTGRDDPPLSRAAE
ncbi:acetyl-CoA carboxylase, carboxyltransferase subunit beta [Rhodothalassium salexigens]|uniref:acetyl-CoA carboxylase, carboxyltransferase subunit beta n=1 Tax=Rhodothalassium salexigens TaxID=1086 RepID=UPI00191470A8|nr:acetyl-CoA carboxylase, carboxyltransferase subunit beta [Rhodothalassium salexigens]MBK5910961.1 acetyl-CoA carboxylase, carboxyltransferase subunit beta [Rhodothalassium salexigens]MBK5921260.1 acetyl-CoA carboxylase, carboxyltransferase subunit beta [Rhodothalassium salexigens]